MERRAVYQIAELETVAALERAATVTLNGRTIEVTFPSRPAQEILARLRAEKFRWTNGRWTYVEEAEAAKELPDEPPPAERARLPISEGLALIDRRLVAAAERAEANARALLAWLPGPVVLLIGEVAEYWA